MAELCQYDPEFLGKKPIGLLVNKMDSEESMTKYDLLLEGRMIRVNTLILLNDILLYWTKCKINRINPAKATWKPRGT